MSLTIDLVERGQPQVVSPQVWQQYELELPMRELAELRVIRLIRSTAGIIVTPGSHVGEMRLPDAALRIAPKSLKLMAAMEAMALRARSRTAHHYERRSGDSGELGIHTAAAFVAALLACIQDGVPWTYETATEVTSYPRGRLLVGPTLRLLANRGAQHRAVVQYPIHRQNATLVRIVRAAYTSLPEWLAGKQDCWRKPKP